MNPHNSIQDIVARAKVQYEAQEFQQAAGLFAAAAESYRQAGDRLTAAEMENNRSVSLLQAGDAQGALEAALNTDAVFAEAGDVRRQAMALANQAAAHAELKHIEPAYELYLRSSDLLKSVGEKDMRAHVLKRIAGLQTLRGDRYAAMATLHTALENSQKLSLKERALKGLMNKVMNLMGGK